jgi:hypothetical protein
MQGIPERGDALVNDYRLRADTGTPLAEPAHDETGTESLA